MPIVRVKDNEPRMKRIIVELFTLEIAMNDFFKPSFYMRKSKRKDETKKFSFQKIEKSSGILIICEIPIDGTKE